MNRRWYIACAALVFLGLLFRQPLLLIVALLTLFVLLTADIWARFCLRNLRFERTLSEHRALFGEEVTLSFVVENVKPLPLPWLEVEDTVPRALAIQGRRLRIQVSTNRAVLENLFSLRWYERVTRRYTITCQARGVHAFGPTSIRSGDLFGLSEHSEVLEERQYLLVYPLVVPLSSFQLPARHPFGDRRAPRRLLEDPLRVAGVRDYMYGDDLRRVHWKASARAMKLQSKVYDPTTTYTLVTFLNVATQLDIYYGIHPELQELSICAAASVTDWALNEGYAVGLYANSMMFLPELGMAETQDPHLPGQEREGMLDQLKRRRILIPPTSNQEQRKRIMEALARIQGFFGSAIENLIQQECSRLPAGTTIVVITGVISEPLLDILSRLKQGGHTVSILMAGNQAVASHLAGIPVYALGGEETWQEFIACYNLPEDAHRSEQQQAIVRAGSFHL
ncbi:MAG TPA: DUF58 domain-containing protein [Ktedonobacteraceae bacterium]|jgi:uncharacterized protein (DUF58 family)